MSEKLMNLTLERIGDQDRAIKAKNIKQVLFYMNEIDAFSRKLFKYRIKKTVFTRGR
jgi:hypothetical protein